MATEKTKAFNALLSAAHDYQQAYGELPIVLRVELYEYFDEWVTIREINVLRSGEVQCTIENRWGSMTTVDSAELSLRPKPRAT